MHARRKPPTIITAELAFVCVFEFPGRLLDWKVLLCYYDERESWRSATSWVKLWVRVLQGLYFVHSRHSQCVSNFGIRLLSHFDERILYYANKVTMLDPSVNWHLRSIGKAHNINI